MLERFVAWLVVVGFSFLLEVFWEIEQSKAFFYIALCPSAVWLVSELRILWSEDDKYKEKPVLFVRDTVGILLGIAMFLFAIWGGARFIEIDFFMVFQITTLVCLLYYSYTEKRF